MRKRKLIIGVANVVAMCLMAYAFWLTQSLFLAVALTVMITVGVLTAWSRWGKYG